MAPSMVNCLLPSYDRAASTEKYQAYPCLVTMHQTFLAPIPATVHSASLDLIPLAPHTGSRPSSDLPSSVPCSLLHPAVHLSAEDDGSGSSRLSP